MDMLQQVVLESLRDLLAKLDTMDQTGHVSMYRDGKVLSVLKTLGNALGDDTRSQAYRASDLAQALRAFLDKLGG